MTDTNNVESQPVLAVAKAPSFCRVCDMELPSPQTWRTHVKSDEQYGITIYWKRPREANLPAYRSVYKLQLKVAEPGSAASPPSPSSPSKDANQKKKAAATSSSRARKEAEISFDAEQDQDQNVGSDSEDDTEDEPSPAPEFVPGNCLFCTQQSSALDENMTHMANAHGFTVPFQDCLAVDVETVLGYLHFVIFSYRECICCGTRRSTVEGCRQHMVAKGHCRFDVSEDTEDFYELPQEENTVADQLAAQRDDGASVRLPSGKHISHRKNVDMQEQKLRTARKAPTVDQNAAESAGLPLGGSEPPGTELVQRGGANGSGELVRSSEALLAARVSKLVLAGVRVQQREEQRKRGRLELANNSVAREHLRIGSGDGRVGRKFC